MCVAIVHPIGQVWVIALAWIMDVIFISCLINFWKLFFIPIFYLHHTRVRSIWVSLSLENFQRAQVTRLFSSCCRLMRSSIWPSSFSKCSWSSSPINWASLPISFITKKKKKPFILSSLLNSLFSLTYLFWVLSLVLVSIPSFGECMSELGSCFNLGDQSTTRLAPWSIEIAFKAAVRNGTAISYWSTFAYISNNLKVIP